MLVLTEDIPMSRVTAVFVFLCRLPRKVSLLEAINGPLGWLKRPLDHLSLWCSFQTSLTLPTISSQPSWHLMTLSQSLASDGFMNSSYHHGFVFVPTFFRSHRVANCRSRLFHKSWLVPRWLSSLWSLQRSCSYGFWNGKWTRKDMDDMTDRDIKITPSS